MRFGQLIGLLISSLLISCSYGESDTAQLPRSPVEFSKYPKVGNRIFGGWSADFARFEPDGVAKFVTVYFNNREMAISVTCMGDRENLVVTASSGIRILKDKILIKRPIHKTVPGKQGLKECSIVLKSPLPYSLRGSQLYLLRTGDSEFESYSRIE